MRTWGLRPIRVPSFKGCLGLRAMGCVKLAWGFYTWGFHAGSKGSMRVEASGQFYVTSAVLRLGLEVIRAWGSRRKAAGF